MQLSENVRKQVLKFQQTEITEYHIYKRLAKQDQLTRKCKDHRTDRGG